MSTPSVLLICMGNICRSPMAEGILRQRAAQSGLGLRIDSAGTHAYHVGQPPDPRARQVARKRGVVIDELRARQVEALDFQRFDHLLVADRQNLDELARRFPRAEQQPQRLLTFAGLEEEDVPDPYYGGLAEFEHVFELLDRAARGLIERLRRSPSDQR